MSSKLPAVVRDMLEEAVIVRVATVMPDGSPHVAPFWFHFDGERIYLSTLDNRTSRNIRRDGRVSVDVDLGSRFGELRQATIAGTARAYDPPGAPKAVVAGARAVDGRHTDEIASPEFTAYEAREKRPQVYVEIEPRHASWWIATGEDGIVATDDEEPAGADS
ncbi:MAG: pyridoxamine 5'-phosphate oxidase family protein [Actinobacteria bacterium]|nr:pyridoxamine 5'-phosphate oxidase family protein [Actinomycetota bacterium]